MQVMAGMKTQIVTLTLSVRVHGSKNEDAIAGLHYWQSEAAGARQPFSDFSVEHKREPEGNWLLALDIRRTKTNFNLDLS